MKNKITEIVEAILKEGAYVFLNPKGKLDIPYIKERFQLTESELNEVLKALEGAPI